MRMTLSQGNALWIALDEHFSIVELVKRGLVARPTNSDALFADIEHRLDDFDLR